MVSFQRMKDYRDAIDALFNANRFGQNGPGFWRYVKTA